jgi:hypothetical protein
MTGTLPFHALAGRLLPHGQFEKMVWFRNARLMAHAL